MQFTVQIDTDDEDFESNPNREVGHLLIDLGKALVAGDDLDGVLTTGDGTDIGSYTYNE